MISYIIVILTLNLLQSHTKAARALIIISKDLEDMDGADEGSEDAESEEIDASSKDTNSEETDSSSEKTDYDETDTSSENTHSGEIDTCSENTNSKETDICSEDTTREDIDRRKNEGTKALKTTIAIETLEAIDITEGTDTTEKSGATKTDDTTEGSEGRVKSVELAEVDLDAQPAEDIQLRDDSSLPFGCECDNPTRCICCGRLEIPQLSLSKETCVRLSYNGDKIALTVTFVVNGKDVFIKTVSANNPPPLCFSYPPGNFIADLCFRFYDIQSKLDKLHTCLELNPRVLHKKIMTIKIGCFKFGGNLDGN